MENIKIFIEKRGRNDTKLHCFVCGKKVRHQTNKTKCIKKQYRKDFEIYCTKHAYLFRQKFKIIEVKEYV
jgi:hypothetical protein